MLATQNPIEQEGTYPLPEAQQDRFMFTVTVGYPNEEDEFQIIESTTSSARPQVDRVVSGDELLAMQALVRKVPAAGYVIRYALKLARLTRPHGQDGEAARRQPSRLREEVRDLGRGSAGRAEPDPRREGPSAAQGPPLRRHRGREGGRAAGAAPPRHHQLRRRADNITPDELIRKLLKEVPVPRRVISGSRESMEVATCGIR